MEKYICGNCRRVTETPERELTRHCPHCQAEHWAILQPYWPEAGCKDCLYLSNGWRCRKVEELPSVAEFVNHEEGQADRPADCELISATRAWERLHLRDTRHSFQERRAIEGLIQRTTGRSYKIQLSLLDPKSLSELHRCVVDLIEAGEQRARNKYLKRGFIV